MGKYRIYLMGSINIDHSVVVRRFPKIGETLKGNDYQVSLGGKGLNQAIACKIYGANLKFLSCIGNDKDKDYVLDTLKKYDVSTDNIVIKDGVHTGQAFINIADGKNEIVTIEGANGSLTKKDVDNFFSDINGLSIFVTQLENNLSITKYALKKAKENDMVTFLNPSPTTKRVKELMPYVDYVIGNLYEFQDVKDYGENLVKRSVITLGSDGVSYCLRRFKTDEVDAIDTTGAGDCFLGAFMSKFSENFKFEDSIKFANKAATMSTLRRGTIESYPTLQEVEDSLKNEQK